ncbi:MAG: DUF4440 domain-containing protein [Pseudomonadota bacterium]
MTDDGPDQSLRSLEEKLLDPAVRGSADLVNRHLAEDFVEFGRSGRVYDKAIMVARLADGPGFDGPRTIVDYSERFLAPTVRLLTYRILENGTLRSSIWRLAEGQWRMVFHQGTG